ncbi:hypothetical protein, partial [uncultured Deefgea sp.]|uniref:hypothetical protein n=1 Tax=uncultured Deefgea sp. TaxID=1304914 RepID=UPI002591A65D
PVFRLLCQQQRGRNIRQPRDHVNTLLQRKRNKVGKRLIYIETDLTKKCSKRQKQTRALSRPYP